MKKLTKKQLEIYNWLLDHPGYLKKGFEVTCNRLADYNSNDILIARDEAKSKIKTQKDLGVIKLPKYKNHGTIIRKSYKIETESNKIYNEIKQMSRPKKSNVYGMNPDNVLFVPDLHAPFIKEGVLEWIREEQKNYNCGTVIFAGDITDGHAWNFHEHDVDGMSVGDELIAAKKQLKEWYKAFPVALVTLGNHDLLVQRKAKTAGLSKYFIKDYGSIIEAPTTWQFGLEFMKHNVKYTHGTTGDAFKVAKESRISTCQGHFHSKTFVQWSVSEKDAIFGMQVGWGADRDKYAFDYGKSFSNKPILSCGVVLEQGRLPFVKLMKL